MARGSAPAPALDISNRQYSILDKEQNRSTCDRRNYQRIHIIFLASKGIPNKQIALQLSITLNTVKKWRNRWQLAYPKLLAYEKGSDDTGVSDVALLKKMLEILKDQARSGAPCRITLSQKDQIVAIACEDPEDYGIIKTDWTLEDLRQVVLDKQIVSTITSVYIGRLLKNQPTPTTQI